MNTDIVDQYSINNVLMDYLFCFNVEESTVNYELKPYPIINTSKSSSIDPCAYGQKGNSDSLMETRN